MRSPQYKKTQRLFRAHDAYTDRCVSTITQLFEIRDECSFTLFPRKPSAVAQWFMEHQPETLVKTLADLAVMGSDTAYGALYVLFRVNSHISSLVVSHFRPHVACIPRTPELRSSVYNPMYLQRRWREAHPGAPLPSAAWSLSRNAEHIHSHFRRSQTNVTFDDVVRADESFVELVVDAFAVSSEGL